MPDGCGLPALDVPRLVRLLGNRTIVFAGDSLSRQVWATLACTLLAQRYVQRSVSSTSEATTAGGARLFYGSSQGGGAGGSLMERAVARSGGV